jgi:ABC-type Na+ transport system ATPase subunit NatA
MIPLRLSTITFIRSSIRKALSRRITTFSSAMKKHVIIATDTMLKNEKIIIIFHRRAAHALLNFRNVFTSLLFCA